MQESSFNFFYYPVRINKYNVYILQIYKHISDYFNCKNKQWLHHKKTLQRISNVKLI
jgi:hypothetical protein